MQKEDKSGHVAGRPRQKKRFGQHFLTDKNVLRKIVEAAGSLDGSMVVEVGPGAGALTEALLKSAARVIAIEIDRQWAEKLREKFSGNENFTLIEKDVLKIEFKEVLNISGHKARVIANLPYNVSTPVLFKFIEERACFRDFILMFQKEVADRLLAMPDTEDYGALTVMVNAYMEVGRIFDVSPNSFTPRPKVWSTVVSIVPREKPLVEGPDEEMFGKVVRAAFGQRRKTLSNALKALGIEQERVLTALEEVGIDPKRRGETLSTGEFLALSKRLS